MPIPFRILGCGNGFNFCPPKLSQDISDGFQTLKGINLAQAMALYWNLYDVKFSGNAKVDFHSQFYYNRSYEFSTDFEETIFDETGRETKVALFADGNFLIEPKEREFGYFSSYDEVGNCAFMLKGPFLNDVDFDIYNSDIYDAIYAYKIYFQVDYSLNEMLISTREINPNHMMFRETVEAKFGDFPFSIYVGTKFNEMGLPDYEFNISDFTPQIYTAQDYEILEE